MYDVTGIGYFTALDFAGRNARVILACRNMDKAVAACSTIREETGNKNIVAKHLEVSSLRSVRRFVDEVTREETRLDVLVNNAGVLGEIRWCTCVREREMFYLTTHSTHFIYGYMASDIWLRTILIVRKETHCRHIGYSYQLTARVLFICTIPQTG